MSTLRRLAAEVRTNRELRREAYSMSLYVSIVLLSALAVFDDDHPPGENELLLLEFGTTLGLVLAHSFASWLSTRLTGTDEDHVDPFDLLRVQLLGAVAVGGLAMLAVISAPTDLELMAARLTVAGTIGVQVYVESKATNSTARSICYGILALLAGAAVAAVKAFISH